ncbi:MAG: hypothetical protein MJK04_27260, partial [Psychrosphaera sp.]|nr:hypothetical protein [Psychrosphaera sp.]
MSVINKNAHKPPKAAQTGFCHKPLPLKTFLLAVQLLLISILPAPLMATDFVNPGPVVTQVNQFGDHKVEDVRSTVQDKAGFLWLGTMNGLLRYDGYNIKGFYHDVNNPDGLNNNDIKKMLLDENNFIWLFTPAGLSRFNPVTEQFTHFIHGSDDPTTIDSPSINSIALADNNKLWIGTNKGINLFDRNSHVNQRLNSQFTVNDGSNPQIIFLIFQDKQKRIWYAVRSQGLSMYDPASKTTSHYLDPDKIATKLEAHMIGSIFQSRDGHIWIGSTIGISRYQPQTNDFVHYSIPIYIKNLGKQVSVKSLYEDNEGRLWIGSFYNSLSVLLPGAKSVINVNQSLGGADIMNAQYINDIFQDSGTTLWIGSAYGGVYKLNTNALAFEHSFVNQQRAFKINTLYKDAKGVMWMGSSQNLYRYHGGSNENNGQFKLEKANVGFITSINGYQDNTLIVSIGNKTLLSYDTQSKQFSPFAVNEQGDSLLPSNSIRAMATTGQGLLWIGANNTDIKNGGLFSYDRQNNQLIHHLDTLVIEAILPLGQHLLIGTKRSGLHLYDPASKKAQRIEAKGQKVSGVWSLYQDSKSRIWVGTNTSGLAQLNMTNLTLSFPLSGGKMPSNMITAITEDKQGDLWLGTSKGISKYSPNSGEVRAYARKDGLRLSNISPKLAAILPDGKIIMANEEQTVKFSPTRLNTLAKQSYQAFPILLSDFKLFNTPVVQQDQDPLSPLVNTINQSQRLTLSHEQYWFSLSFSSSDYKNLNNIRYAYKLEGLSDKWLETDNSNRIAVFTSLPAKDYQLQIKTSTPNGGWSDTVRTLDITITPPWWLTWQAYLLYAFAIISSSIS